MDLRLLLLELAIAVWHRFSIRYAMFCSKEISPRVGCLPSCLYEQRGQYWRYSTHRPCCSIYKTLMEKQTDDSLSTWISDLSTALALHEGAPAAFRHRGSKRVT